MFSNTFETLMNLKYNDVLVLNSKSIGYDYVDFYK